jgi:hypothetical protein
MLVYNHPGLQGLELWHGLAANTTLHQLRHDKPAYAAGLDGFLEELHAGTAQTADGDSLALAAGFDRLLLTGGDAAELSPALARPHELVNPGPFAARPGAEAIWSELGWHDPLAIDLGQSRLKWFTRDTSGTIERGRAQFRELVQRALPPTYDGVLLALPTAIDHAGNAGSCSYSGLYGPVASLFANLFNAPWVVCNDAVLAARGYPPATQEKTLVLTLGFGVGAALWHSQR